MTADQFRELAPSLSGRTEVGHMSHPDFRVRNKIFATLGYPVANWAMVKLTPEQQEQFAEDEPDVFAPIKGGWGRKGATQSRSGGGDGRDCASVRRSVEECRPEEARE